MAPILEPRFTILPKRRRDDDSQVDDGRRNARRGSRDVFERNRSAGAKLL
jgi:hypothetical protein